MRAFCIWCRAKKAIHVRGFPDSSTGEESGCNAGEHGSIAGWGKKPLERDKLPTPVFLGFPCGSAGKESACNVGSLGLTPGWEYALQKGKPYPLQYAGLEHYKDCRSPGEGNGYPLEYSSLENSMD